MTEVAVQQLPPIQTPDQTQVWPDNAPSVSMDIELGKQYDYVGFDPYMNDALLDHMGVEDKTKLNILIKQRIKSSRTLGESSGRYSRSTDSIETALDYGTEEANSTLIHEEQHAADAENGESDKSDEAVRMEAGRLIYKIKCAGAVATGAALGFGANEVIEKVAPFIPLNDSGLRTGLFVAIAALSHAGKQIAAKDQKIYKEFDTGEMRARATENDPYVRENFGSIITTVKK